ncbi:MAG: nuclear transport factor 2 family protein [Nocardioidaceae bacterium]
MAGRTNEADIAGVIDVARAYYDGMIAGDEKLLTSAFHPRACIVGNYEGELEWQTLEEFIAEYRQGAEDAGPYEWRVDAVSLVGDTAEIRLGSEYAGEWFSDDLSLLRVDGTWCIVHKTWYVHPLADRAESRSAGSS